MGRKKPAGLFNRDGIWHIDKQIGGRRICRSCETSDQAEAETFLAKVIEEQRQSRVYGIRPKRSFEQAAAKYVLAYQHKKSIDTDISYIKQLLPSIGHIPINEIHQGTLEEWVAMRQEQGKATNTINHGLKMVRRILNVAASEFIDEHRLTWLENAPKIKLMSVHDQRDPYPITWDEQNRLFSFLPEHLKDMCMFAVNTGCRDQEICHLRWQWELTVPELNTSIFVIPREFTKNKRDKFIVLNKLARDVIEKRRGIHPEFVFSYRDNGLYQINNSGWKKAREQAGLGDLHVHDLRHTFATRLRDLGTSFEDCRDLLGHKPMRQTDGYCHATISRLHREVQKLCPNAFGGYPKIVLLRVSAGLRSRKIPAGKKKRSAA